MNNLFQYRNYIITNFADLKVSEIKMVRIWRNKPNVRKWMFNKNIITEEEHKSFIDKLKRDRNNIYWLIKDKFNRSIGVIALKNINYDNDQAHIGIYKNPAKYKYLYEQGKNLMEMLMHIAFKKFGIRKLLAEVFSENIKAINLYKKSGFKIIDMQKSIITLSLKNTDLKI